jgi:hypothetical protein
LRNDDDITVLEHNAAGDEGRQVVAVSDLANSFDPDHRKPHV